MEIPPSITVPICIERGSIYLFRLEITNRDGTSWNGERFFIVLNVNPKTDEVLVLTTITSQVEKAEAYIQRVGEDFDTLVRISPSDFSRLTQDSVVNCNNVYPTTKEDLINKLGEPKAVIFFERLPKSIIDALVTGVLKSTQVQNEYKKLLI